MLSLYVRISYLCLLLVLSICIHGSYAAVVSSDDNPIAEFSTTLSLKQLLSSPELLTTLATIHQKNKITQHNSRASIDSSEESGIPEGEDLILSLYIKETAYSELYVGELFAIKSRENAKLSLISFFEVLDFAIDVDVEGGLVNGWFISEDNNFELHLTSDNSDAIEVLVNDQHSIISNESFEIIDNDLFVEASVIEKWFGLEFQFNYSDLIAKLTTQTALPIQLSLARKNKRKAGQYNNTAVHPWKETGYQPISAPLFDVQLNTSINQDQWYGSYSVLSVQDIAYFSSELYLSGYKDDTLNQARLTFSKEDKDSKLLGPLKATNYQFGDITPVKLANSNTSGESRGLRFSNQQSALITDNKTTTISGNIQKGWDAELYRNGLFIDRQLLIQNGRYDFRDVVLFFGDNNFEVILYGPQGQVQEVTTDYYVDSNILKAKESTYDVSFNQVNETVFGVSENNRNLADLKVWQGAVNVSKGLTDNLSINVGGAYFLNEENEDYYQYSAGVSLSPLKALLLSADFQQDNLNNNSLKLSGRTLWSGQSFSLIYNKQYIKPEDKAGISAHNYQFIMSGNILSNSIIPLSYQNEWRHSFSDNDNDNDNDSKSFNNQIAYRNNFFSASNQLYWVGENKATGIDDRFFGTLDLQKSFSTLYTRLGAVYNLSPETEFTQIQGDLSYPLTNKLSSTFALTHSFENERYWAKLGLNMSFDSILVNSTAMYNSDDKWSIGLYTSFGFGYEPISNEIFMAKGAMARNGVLVARVFEDDNLNGVFDEGENLLEGVRVKAVQSHRQEYTNSDGVAVLKNLTHGKRTDIIIDPKTVEDPFMIPATPGVSITGRKGFIDVLDIPMVNAGELDGTVYLKDKRGNDIAGAYLNIHLHNEKGDLVASTETEFDGYYLFTDLVPGKYTASIDIEDIKRKNLHDAKVLEFEFSAAGDVIAGADFVIQRYTFVKGYTVDLGEFHSLILLKAFWQIIKPTYNNALQQQVFYSENSAEGLFRINAAFFKGKGQADRACQYLQKQDINCAVKEFEFNL